MAEPQRDGDRYIQLASDLQYRLQVCFPTYHVSYALRREMQSVFVTLRLSLDDRDEWTEHIPDRDGRDRAVSMVSFNMQLPMPNPSDAGAMRYFRQKTMYQFIEAWFAERMKRVGLEP